MALRDSGNSKRRRHPAGGGAKPGASSQDHATLFGVVPIQTRSSACVRAAPVTVAFLVALVAVTYPGPALRAREPTAGAVRLATAPSADRWRALGAIPREATPRPLPHRPGNIFLAGEAGLFLVADISGPYEERHARLVTSVPWEGSFFTSLDTADGAIVVGGLRGQMFRTTDAGDTWTVVEKPPTSSIVDSVRLPDDRLIFVGIAGEILASNDNGDSFTKLPVTSGDRIYTVAAVGNDTLLVGGPNGIQKVSLSQ